MAALAAKRVVILGGREDTYPYQDILEERAFFDDADLKFFLGSRVGFTAISRTCSMLYALLNIYCIIDHSHIIYLSDSSQLVLFLMLLCRCLLSSLSTSRPHWGRPLVCSPESVIMRRILLHSHLVVEPVSCDVRIGSLPLKCSKHISSLGHRLLIHLCDDPGL